MPLPGKTDCISMIDINRFSWHHASMLRKYLLLFLAAFACMLTTEMAYAFTATKNMNISVVVPPIVQLSASPMAFGTITARQTALATAVVTVNMVATQAYKITLDAGLHKSGERRMSDGRGNFHSYVLYKNSARTQRWGDSAFAATYAAGSSLVSTGTGKNQLFVVYGTALSAASPAGAYSDLVTVTVHY